MQLDARTFNALIEAEKKHHPKRFSRRFDAMKFSDDEVSRMDRSANAMLGVSVVMLIGIVFLVSLLIV